MDPPQLAQRKRGKTKNEVECAQIVTAKTLGMTTKALATKFKLSRSQINRIVKKYRATEVLARKKGTGRKRKTTPLEDRLIYYLIGL
jgi:transposase